MHASNRLKLRLASCQNKLGGYLIPIHTHVLHWGIWPILIIKEEHSQTSVHYRPSPVYVLMIRVNEFHCVMRACNLYAYIKYCQVYYIISIMNMLYDPYIALKHYYWFKKNKDDL